MPRYVLSSHLMTYPSVPINSLQTD